MWPILANIQPALFIRNAKKCKVAVSGGSNYNAQSTPVFKALGIATDMEIIRFSFSDKNTMIEIDDVIKKLALQLKSVVAKITPVEWPGA